ncbi:transposase [Staphylococcus intermedius]|uniref:Transposase for IS1272 n=1 Tax=Staphylococcus intermedius NCTC 11048 TaxID=1141106 RepID=A0A380G6U7_STAIN|nr:transposase [Staphylococcus intermedius]PNZ50958.1 hypothetical protein CD138_10630 [Staphylococcus intermedius NCTC 11048]PCF80626.1 transposase [Staphylococcus intermedius]PCF81975.1 transposase [Staphylococcus intermedius]PCF88311.1 transposase [Staphylococcus intermedius]
MYKNYNLFQLTLPIEIEMSFPENDVAFVINKLVESIPQEAFNSYYSQIGPSSSPQKMMLKIILYSYANSVFSG